MSSTTVEEKKGAVSLSKRKYAAFIKVLESKFGKELTVDISTIFQDVFNFDPTVSTVQPGHYEKLKAWRETLLHEKKDVRATQH